MKRYALLLGAVLVAGAVSLQADDSPADKADDAKGKVTAEVVKKVADMVAKGADWETLQKAGKELAAKHNLDHVMRPMKRRTDMLKSGLGIGSTPGSVTPDGIEAMFTLNMPKWKTLPNNFAATKEDFAKAADVMAAISSISVHQCKVDKKMGQKDPVDWKKWMKDMYDNSVALGKAIRAQQPDLKAIKEISKKLGDTCTDCHAVFRD